MEAPVATGRRFSSDVNRSALSGGVTAEFEKAGAQTVAAFAKKWYNTSSVPLFVRKVVASIGTAPTGAGLVVDAKINGTSVFAAAGDRCTIAATKFTGSAVPTAVGDLVRVNPGSYVEVNVTVVGSTVAGSDLAVTVLFG